MSNKGFYLYIDGQPVEVSEEVYQEYYRGERKEKYFMVDLKVEYAIADQEMQTVTVIPSREDSYERLLAADKQFPDLCEPLEAQVIRTTVLKAALQTLTEEEQEIVRELYYLGKTERQVSEVLHIAKTTLRRKRKQLLDKLREQLKENF